MRFVRLLSIVGIGTTAGDTLLRGVKPSNHHRQINYGTVSNDSGEGNGGGGHGRCHDKKGDFEFVYRNNVLIVNCKKDGMELCSKQRYTRKCPETCQAIRIHCNDSESTSSEDNDKNGESSSSDSMVMVNLSQPMAVSKSSYLATAAGACLIFGVGIWVGTHRNDKRITRNGEKEKDLPNPTQCPTDGVTYVGQNTVPLQQAKIWLFLGTHLANLDLINSAGISGDVKLNDAHRLHHGYPVRLLKSAGFMRAWGMRKCCMLQQHSGGLGDQTGMTVIHVKDHNHDKKGKSIVYSEPHDMVGVLVPIHHLDGIPDWLIRPKYLISTEFKNVEWLGWTSPPLKPSDTIQVFSAKTFPACKPPCARMPILQSYVDLVAQAAAVYGQVFAVEWFQTTHWWLSSHKEEENKINKKDTKKTDATIYYLNDREEARRPWHKLPAAFKIDNVLKQITYQQLSEGGKEKDHGNGVTGTSILEERLHESEYGVKHCEAMLSRMATKALLSSVTDKTAGLKFYPLSKQHTPVLKIQNFLFGFGSIIQSQSRKGSDPSAPDAAPCRIQPEWGFVREWNFQAATAQICALGLRKTKPNEKGASINGVIFPAPSDLNDFDKRENGYMRVVVPVGMVETLSWHVLPPDANVFAYIPYAPSVVEKYGVDPETGYPRCSSFKPPDGLDMKTEGPGLGLKPPSLTHPILQTYLDVVITGCLEYGEDFCREFIKTTFLWSPYWLNERTLSRRPWLHQKKYVKIDKILREELGEELFLHRKLESEYAALFP